MKTKKPKVIKEKPLRVEVKPFAHFSSTTDMLILQLRVENGKTNKQIADLLGREEEAVTERIKYLKESGKLKEIHKMLIGHKGAYVMKYLEKKIKASGVIRRGE